MKLKLITITTALTINATAQNWQLGGNPSPPLNATNNRFGTLQNFSIWHQTNGFNRMVMWNGGSAQFEGRVAIGNNLPNNFVPSSRLELSQFGTSPNGNMFRTDGDQTQANLWQLYTGISATNNTEKYRLAVMPNNNDVVESTVTNANYHWQTNMLRRATLFNTNLSNGGSGSGALAIHSNPSNPITSPTSLFNIGETTFFGAQTWMRVGMSLGFDNDMAYVGLKTEGSDRSDLVLAWGNDGAGTWGPDVLRFHHTSTQSELARFAPNGGNGFGNFYAYGINTQPVRRLEILDSNPTGGNANAPQLRLSYTYNSNPALGVFTEFQTTSIGDLYFNTRDNNTARNFGFHKLNPLNTVEINAQLSSPYLPSSPNGSSGLRFTNLKSSNTPLTNGFNGVDTTKVLTVDANGDVVLIKAGGGSNGLANANNGISTNAGVAQLGVPCNINGFPNFNGILANQFTEDRVVPNRNFNFWFGSLNTETGGVGIGGQPNSNTFCNTGNTFEISANSKNTKYGFNNASGLRFTKLRSVDTVVANGVYGVDATKVLTVDQDGDVVLTNAISGNGDNGLSNNGPTAGLLHLGQNANTVGNPGKLLNNREIPMNNQSLYFTQTTKNSGIGVGYLAGSGLNASIDVFTWDTIKKNGVRSLFATTDYAPNNITHSGYFSNTLLTHPLDVNIVGVRGDAWFGSGFAAGVMGIAAGSPDRNYGGMFLADGAINEDIAVYGAVDTLGTNNYAGYFVGDVFTTGGATSGSGYLTASDARIKRNVNSVGNSLALLKQLRPVSYNYNKGYAPQLNLNNSTNYGFIAQEVEEVIPQIVETKTVLARQNDTTGNEIFAAKELKALNYDGLIPFAIKGIQELDSLQQKTNDRVDSLVAHPTTGGGAMVAQNGLTNYGTNSIELGGALLHNTIIDNGNNTITFINSSGNFIVGNTNNIVTSKTNNIFGDGNSVLSTNGVFGANYVVGSNNFLENSASKIFGSSNKVNGSSEWVLGNNNEVDMLSTGSSNLVIGTSNKVEGLNNQVHGLGNVIVTDPLYNSPANESYAIGNYNYAYNGGIAIGNKVVTPANLNMVSIGSHYGNPTAAINNYFLANSGNGFKAVANAHLASSLAETDFIPALNIDANNRVGVKKYIASVALDINGSIMANGITLTSDSTLKTNIHNINIDAIGKLKQFRPVTFEWVNKADTGMFGVQYGFTAQQIESVMPDFVKTGKDGIKTLNQQAIIPLLVKAVQQLQSNIDSLKAKLNNKDSIQDARMANIEAMLQACCQNPNNARVSTSTPLSNQNAIDIELSDKDVIVLTQNVPNPFAEQTTIAYNVPSKVIKAQIIFYNAQGQIIETVDIKTRGKGKLNVFASDLSSGLYHYTLVADGKVVDSKKMVRE